MGYRAPDQNLANRAFAAASSYAHVAAAHDAWLNQLIRDLGNKPAGARAGVLAGRLDSTVVDFYDSIPDELSNITVGNCSPGELPRCGRDTLACLGGGMVDFSYNAATFVVLRAYGNDPGHRDALRTALSAMRWGP